MQHKSLPSLLAALLSLPLFATAGTGCSCGDDDGDDVTEQPDAREQPDADPDDPDADPGLCNKLECPEGGEVRVEYVNYTDPAPGARTNAARVTGFFLSNAGTGEDPDMHPFEIDPDEGGCWDIVDAPFWPGAQSEGREYIDVGQLVISGGPNALTVGAGAVTDPPTRDTWYRTHDDWHWHFGTDDAATYLDDNIPFSFTLTGSATFEDRHYMDVGFIPKTFGDLDPPGGSGPIVITPGEPMTFSHEVVESDTNQRVISAMAFVVAGRGIEVCVELQDDGVMEVPAATIDHVLSVGSTGTVARQTFTHNPVDLEVEGEHRRIDVIGVWCYVTPWVAAVAVD